jgi:hypothetical protein
MGCVAIYRGYILFFIVFLAFCWRGVGGWWGRGWEKRQALIFVFVVMLTLSRLILGDMRADDVSSIVVAVAGVNRE